jgi:hypothetical protein
MLKMLSVRINERLDKFSQGPKHPFKYSGVVAECLTGIQSRMVKCLFIVNIWEFMSPTYENPEDSNPESLEATK